MHYNVDRTAVVGHWLLDIIVTVTVFMIGFLFNFFLSSYCFLDICYMWRNRVCLFDSLFSVRIYILFFTSNSNCFFFVLFFQLEILFQNRFGCFSPFSQAILVCVAPLPLKLSSGWSGMQRIFLHCDYFILVLTNQHSEHIPECGFFLLLFVSLM